MAAGRFCRQTPAAAWWGKLPPEKVPTDSPIRVQLPSGERPALTEPAGENKGRHTLGAVGQESSEETSVASKMPSRNPRRGFLTENTVHRTIFLFSCACWRYKTLGALPLLGCRLGQALDGAHRAPAPPAAFEKVDETFTRLRRARELIVRTGVSVAHRPKARIARGATPAHAS